MNRRQRRNVLNKIKTFKDFRLALNDLYQRLEDVEDYRSEINKKYALADILFLLVLGLIFGKNDPTNIHHYLSLPKIKRQICKHLKYKGDIPSKQVFLRTVAEVPPLSFIAVMNEWIRCYSPTNKAHIALDGKAVRAALSKIENKHNPPYNLNAVIVGTGLFALHEKVGDKTSETAVLPKTASMLELEDSMVTVDAAGTHGNLADLILSSDGHYLLPLKDNQKIMLHKTEEAFNTSAADLIKISIDDRSDEKSHGRYEKRTHSVLRLDDCSDLKQFFDHDTSFAGMVGSVCKVVRERAIEKINEAGERYQETSEQTLYYITDRADISPEEFGEFALGHWRCEQAHFILDVVFREDLSTIRKGYGMENMSLIRKVAYNILTIFMMVVEEKLTYQRARDVLFINMDKYLINIFKRSNSCSSPPSPLQTT